MRRRLGGALVAVGVLLLGFAGAEYAEGAVAQEQARERWEIAAVRARFDAVRSGAGLAPIRVPGAPVARLVVPRIGLDEVVVEGVGEDELNAGPGHLPGSAMPGERGNAVISAHRDRHFNRLGELAIGDTVVTETGAERQRWVIAARQVVKAGAPALRRSETPILTLTTCWPIRWFGTAPERLLLTARPVEAGAAPSH